MAAREDAGSRVGLSQYHHDDRHYPLPNPLNGEDTGLLA